MSWCWRDAEQNGVPLKVEESLPRWSFDPANARVDPFAPFVITPLSFPWLQYTIYAETVL